MKTSITLAIFLSSLSVFAQDVSYPPAAKSAAEARATLQARRDHIIDQIAAMPMAKAPTPPKLGFQEYITTSIAKLTRRQDLAAVSSAIMTSDFHPWLNGTDIAIAGSFCKRVGDYDFILMGLTRMAYLDHEAGDNLLSPEARNKLRHELLSLRGTQHHIKFTLDKCPQFVKIRDSENHILMSETARYLNNQLLLDETNDPAFDNSKNGFNEWYLEHLSTFLRTEYDEMNSRPYQGYTMIAVATLYTHARDPKIKEAARMMLDYLAAKVAIQSKGLRRYAPFRRQIGHRDAQNFSDSETGMWWAAFHAGNYDFVEMNEKLNENYKIEAYHYFMAATSSYEMPDMILDLYYNQSTPFFQKIKGRDVEIYYNSKSFLLSAGGRARKVWGYFKRDNDVWALPISIIPKTAASRITDVFSITGNADFSKRNNNCVAENFACGTNLKVPAGIPEENIVKSKDWTFYNMNEYFVATNQQDDRVMLEVREATTDFQSFHESILKANRGSFSKKGINTFTTSTGSNIQFDWSNKDLDSYPVKSVNGVVMKNTKEWPLAEGNVIESKGDGLITIRNPATGERLMLDDREIQNPRRAMVK